MPWRTQVANPAFVSCGGPTLSAASERKVKAGGGREEENRSKTKKDAKAAGMVERAEQKEEADSEL